MDKVVEKDEHGKEVVYKSERIKALLGFVPCFKLFVETLDEIVGNIVAKALYTDELHIAVKPLPERLAGFQLSFNFTVRK